MDKEAMIDMIMLNCKLHELVNSVKDLYDHFKKFSDSYSKWFDSFVEKTNNLRIPGNDCKLDSGEGHSDKVQKDQLGRRESPFPQRVVTPSAPTLSEILEVEEEKEKKTGETANVSQEKAWLQKGAEEKLVELLKSMEPRKIGMLLQTLRPSDWKEILTQPLDGIVNSLENILSDVEQSDGKSPEFAYMGSELEVCSDHPRAIGIKYSPLPKGITTNDGIPSSSSTVGLQSTEKGGSSDGIASSSSTVGLQSAEKGGSSNEPVVVKNGFIGKQPTSEQRKFTGIQPFLEEEELMGIVPTLELLEDIDECFDPQWVFPAMNEEYPASHCIKDSDNHSANQTSGFEGTPVLTFDPHAPVYEMYKFGGIPVFEIMSSSDEVGEALLDAMMNGGIM